MGALGLIPTMLGDPLSWMLQLPWTIFMLIGIWRATRAGAKRGRRMMRYVSRAASVVAALSGGALMGLAAPHEAPLIAPVFAAAGLALALSFSAFTRALIRPESALAAEFRGLQIRLMATVAAPAAALIWLGVFTRADELAVCAAAGMALALVYVWVRSAGALHVAFLDWRQAEDVLLVSPETDILETNRWTASVGAMEATLWPADAQLPAEVGVSIALPALAALAPELSIVGRGDEASRQLTGPEVTTRDPILDRLVQIRGVDEALARALTAGLHEQLLPVLNEVPGARIADGQLIAAVPAVSFSAYTEGWLAAFGALAEALEARAVEQTSRTAGT